MLLELEPLRRGLNGLTLWCEDLLASKVSMKLVGVNADDDDDGGQCQYVFTMLVRLLEGK